MYTCIIIIEVLTRKQKLFSSENAKLSSGAPQGPQLNLLVWPRSSITSLTLLTDNEYIEFSSIINKYTHSTYNPKGIFSAYIHKNHCKKNKNIIKRKIHKIHKIIGNTERESTNKHSDKTILSFLTNLRYGLGQHQTNGPSIIKHLRWFRPCPSQWAWLQTRTQAWSLVYFYSPLLILCYLDFICFWNVIVDWLAGCYRILHFRFR